MNIGLEQGTVIKRTEFGTKLGTPLESRLVGTEVGETLESTLGATLGFKLGTALEDYLGKAAADQSSNQIPTFRIECPYSPL